MNREYHKWWSHNLERDMEMLVFGHAGAKVLVFPTRGGRFYEYENIRMVDRIRDKIESGKMQLFCVDSVDAESFYCFWAHPSGRIARHQQYEKYIVEEVVPFMNVQNPHYCTISHGCSLGAFHAANVAFRHPHLFQKLCAFSGRYDLTLQVEYFDDLLDGYYNDEVYFNTPTHFLPNLQCNDTLNNLKNMDIVMVIGEEDPFLENNKHLSQILHEKGIDHELHVWRERAHRGYYWRRMVTEYL
ncbi:esterase [Saccharobesus litoralis]|uniref:Esterase n=1 Tax=Saccharobesus litoralis TaxID=2172099 RepID=A0A2S0VPV5_9ALTE|nr:alpha/beta hydrolase-fold protein [Saccharobesus litoralis]AWB66229.1 esterase [Saccharobesus litoralis]